MFFFLKVFSGTSCGIQLFLIEIKCCLLDLKVIKVLDKIYPYIAVEMAADSSTFA